MVTSANAQEEDEEAERRELPPQPLRPPPPPPPDESVEDDAANGSADNEDLSNKDEAEDEAEALPAVPPENREPSPSVGSAEHANKACKPCAHYWKPAGCNKGYDCTYCHMCSFKEWKAYQSKKKSGSKKMMIQGRYAKMQATRRAAKAAKKAAALEPEEATMWLGLTPTAIEETLSVDTRSTSEPQGPALLDILTLPAYIDVQVTPQLEAKPAPEEPMVLQLSGHDRSFLAAESSSQLCDDRVDSFVLVRALLARSSRLLRRIYLHWGRRCVMRSNVSLRLHIERQRHKMADALERQRDRLLLNRCFYTWQLWLHAQGRTEARGEVKSSDCQPEADSGTVSKTMSAAEWLRMPEVVTEELAAGGSERGPARSLCSDLAQMRVYFYAWQVGILNAFEKLRSDAKRAGLNEGGCAVTVNAGSRRRPRSTRRRLSDASVFTTERRAAYCYFYLWSRVVSTSVQVLSC
eukprot:TRINITY_DN12645_c0_g1_i2.p1 TRINITY_DN12645_c0_g1~~TRINITY_DN12645_c0_g1_i2.p1  ORF type:complete len:465 (+),score=94.23 TRINITY_DN12645_c0_g1_i2:108-1502(+)